MISQALNHSDRLEEKQNSNWKLNENLNSLIKSPVYRLPYSTNPINFNLKILFYSCMAPPLPLSVLLYRAPTWLTGLIRLCSGLHITYK